MSFPQRYAAASLKPQARNHVLGRVRGFSAALCCGLIEATPGSRTGSCTALFSAALCCGLIEAAMVAYNNGGTYNVFRSVMLRPH